METALVDTSGFYAFLDRDDQFHQRAAQCWRALIDEGRLLLAHNYVLVETIAWRNAAWAYKRARTQRRCVSECPPFLG
jgi:predicted nucleic acid-binding protein